jgi:hypothetical protein
MHTFVASAGTTDTACCKHAPHLPPRIGAFAWILGFSSISVASSSPQYSEPAQNRSIYGRLIPAVKRLMRFRDFTLKKISRQQNTITHGLGKLEVYLAVVLYVKDIVLQVVHIFMKTYNL